MLGQLITLPLRLSARTASLMLRGTEAVLTRALALAGHPVTADPPPPPPAPVSRPRPARRTPRRQPPPPPVPDPPRPPAAPRAEQLADVPEQPVHVSEEPELVREVAEPGAEDGAGAQVTIDEPWQGYAQLNAKDVIARFAVASQAELAAVSLYESAHQARQTVLSAVERQLALAARGSTPN